MKLPARCGIITNEAPPSLRCPHPIYFGLRIFHPIWFSNYVKYPTKQTIHPATIYHAHILEILDSLPDAILCFTDGSKIGNRTGFAFFVASDSSSPLTPISDVHSTHPFVSRIHTFVSNLLSTSYTVTLVDAPTKVATSHPRVNSEILPTKADLSLIIRRHITDHWISLWQNQTLSNRLAYESNHYPSHGSRPTKHFVGRKFGSHVFALTHSTYVRLSPF